MTDPCAVDECVDQSVVRRYGCLKWLVLLFLLCPIGILLLQGLRSTILSTSIRPSIDIPASAEAPSVVTLSGTGAKNSSVAILKDGTVIGRAEVDSDGDWSLNTTIDEPGEYRFEALGLNFLGNPDRSNGSGAKVLTVTEAIADAPEEEPTPTSGAPAIPPTLVVPAGDLSVGPVTFFGEGTTGTTIEVLGNGASLGQTEVNAGGNWRLETDLDEAGDLELIARSLDADGNELAVSAPALVTVASVPDTPTVDVEAPTLNLPTAGLTAGAVTLAGIGTPDTVLQLLGNGDVLGQTDVDTNGDWSLETTLEEGNIELIAQTLDADGNVIAASAPLIAEVAAEGTSEPGEETVEGDDTPLLNLPDGDISAGPLTLTGTGTPGSVIDVFRNGVLLGATTVGADGTWSLDVNIPDDGAETKLDVALSDGTPVEPTPDEEVAEPAEGEDEEATEPTEGEEAETPAVAPLTFNVPSEDTLDFELGSDNLPSGSLNLTGTGEPDGSVEILVDGESLGSTAIDANGDWAFDEVVTLEPGTRDLLARMNDADGNELAESATVSIVVPDVAAALRPQITSVERLVDEDGVISGTVKIAGTALPDANIAILEDGTEIGQATADDTGAWQCDCPLSAGEHTLAARDEASGLESASVTIRAAKDGITADQPPATGNGTATDCSGAPQRGTIAGRFYVVAPCEYFSLIAARLGVSPQALRRANPQVTNPDFLYAGQKLRIPGR